MGYLLIYKHCLCRVLACLLSDPFLLYLVSLDEGLQGEQYLQAVFLGPPCISWLHGFSQRDSQTEDQRESEGEEPGSFPDPCDSDSITLCLSLSIALVFNRWICCISNSVRQPWPLGFSDLPPLGCLLLLICRLPHHPVVIFQLFHLMGGLIPVLSFLWFKHFV